MWNSCWAAAVSALLAAASAGAQTAKPEPAAEAASAAASAAMERAKRQAAGPMRLILEASKSRRKTAEPDTPTPPPAETISLRTVASRPAAPTALPTAPETVTRSVAAAQPAPEPVTAPVTAPVSAEPAVSAPPGVVTLMTLSSAALQGKGVTTPVPGLAGVSGALAAAPLPTSPLALPNLSVGPARVKLVTQVDPELAQRQLDSMGRNAVVAVDLTIRADGSVSAVTLVPPSPRGIQRAVVDALELWRFEPLPSERVLRVELIFNREP